MMYEKLIKTEGVRKTFHCVQTYSNGLVVAEWGKVETPARNWESTPIDGLGYLGKKIGELEGFTLVEQREIRIMLSEWWRIKKLRIRFVLRHWFVRCPECGRHYWRGDHIACLAIRVNSLGMTMFVVDENGESTKVELPQGDENA